MFIGGGGTRCVQSNCPKNPFSLHPDHRCYSKNKMLGRLPECYKKFFSFHFVSTAAMNCNPTMNLFFCFSSQFNLHSLFLQGFLMWFHFYTTVYPAIDHWFEEAVVETGDEFSIVYIFKTFFVSNVYFRVQ